MVAAVRAAAAAAVVAAEHAVVIVRRIVAVAGVHRERANRRERMIDGQRRHRVARIRMVAVMLLLLVLLVLVLLVLMLLLLLHVGEKRIARHELSDVGESARTGVATVTYASEK